MNIKPFMIYVAMSLFAIPIYGQGTDSSRTLSSSKGGSDLTGQVNAQRGGTGGKVTLGPYFKIEVSNDGKERQFPFVYRFGKNIFVSYSEHHDAVIASPVDAMVISRNKGKTWTNKITHPDFFISSMVKKRGVLYGIVYFTYPDSSAKERMVYWTSDDKGKTWNEHSGVVYAPKGKQFTTDRGVWGSILFHRGMQVMDDGSIQGVMYGLYAGEKKYTVVWVKSNDNCKTWRIVSTVASGIPEDNTLRKPQGFCEPAFARVKDGSILCVMRMGSYLPLFQSRSYDNGLTWTKPVTLPGLSATASESVDPNLVLMKNGVLALTYGRPGDKIAFSTDGCGYNWDYHLNTYSGETTGYTGIVEVRHRKLLLILDQGRTGAKEMAIGGRFIDVGLKPRSVRKH